MAELDYSLLVDDPEEEILGNPDCYNPGDWYRMRESGYKGEITQEFYDCVLDDIYRICTYIMDSCSFIELTTHNHMRLYDKMVLTTVSKDVPTVVYSLEKCYVSGFNLCLNIMGNEIYASASMVLTKCGRKKKSEPNQYTFHLTKPEGWTYDMQSNIEGKIGSEWLSIILADIQNMLFGTDVDSKYYYDSESAKLFDSVDHSDGYPDEFTSPVHYREYDWRERDRNEPFEPGYFDMVIEDVSTNIELDMEEIVPFMTGMEVKSVSNLSYSVLFKADTQSPKWRPFSIKNKFVRWFSEMLVQIVNVDNRRIVAYVTLSMCDDLEHPDVLGGRLIYDSEKQKWTYVGMSVKTVEHSISDLDVANMLGTIGKYFTGEYRYAHTGRDYFDEGLDYVTEGIDYMVTSVDDDYKMIRYEMFCNLMDSLEIFEKECMYNEHINSIRTCPGTTPALMITFDKVPDFYTIIKLDNTNELGKVKSYIMSMYVYYKDDKDNPRFDIVISLRAFSDNIWITYKPIDDTVEISQNTVEFRGIADDRIVGFINDILSSIISLPVDISEDISVGSLLNKKTQIVPWAKF